ncbi:fimbrial protein StaE [Salmonella enterica subsp. enterica serovar Enteritidis]|nr:fimbrial protein StaE [Salmonella enterica subsp. enterica serovar Enteritidis]EIO9993569.1 fimbrial protein StaE [Salmonella enterica subsp. enterica serovar Enteritidis]
MKHTPIFLALALVGGLFTHAASADITGTPSLSAKFVTTVVAGTCTATVKQGSTTTDTINFGDVFKSDIGTRTEPFKIAFSDCAGVNSAKIAAQAGSGNTCDNNSASFAATGIVNTHTAVEIWGGSADSGTQLACASGAPSNAVTASIKKAATAEYDMNARWVAASGYTAAQAVAGDASSAITFVVTYE